MLVVYDAGMLHQIRRLLDAIYSPRHLYLIHVDASSSMLVGLLDAVLKRYPNVMMAPFRFRTVWGSSQLYRIYLAGIAELLRHPDWDFFINLSEADFPIAPLATVEAELQQRGDANFLKSRADNFNEARFVRKQGLNWTFYQCDDHMFKVAERNMAVFFDLGLAWPHFTRL